MSSHQRKRRGGAVDSKPACKRSRLLPSSAGGTSQAELRDLEESGTLSFEPAGEEVIDLIGESPEPEVIDLIVESPDPEVIEALEINIIVISDDESAGNKEQSEQQPHLSRASENSAEPLAREDGEELRENYGAWPPSVLSSPLWLDENSRDWVQSPQPSHLSRSAENSAGLLTTGGEEERRDNYGAWPAGPATPPARENESSALQDREQRQQQPLGSRAADNSADPWASDTEKESQDNDRAWTARVLSPPLWLDENSWDWVQSPQPSHLSRSAENSAGLLTTGGEEERRDNYGAWPAGPAAPPARENESSELQDREQRQQQPLGSRAADNSADLWASDTEEESQDNDSSIDSSEWPDTVESSSTWEDDTSEDWEESQEYPFGSRAGENSPELVPSNLLQEPIDIEFEWPGSVFSSPAQLDENSRDWVQSPQPSHLSRSAENSAGLLMTGGEEERRDNYGAWPAGPATPPARENESSALQDREQRQQQPLGSRAADNSADLWASDTEEESQDNDSSIDSSEWPDTVESSSTWEDDSSEDWEESQEYPFGSRAGENSPELVPSNLLQEPIDIEFEWPGSVFSSPAQLDENSRLPEVHGQQRRNVTLNSHEQVDGSGIGPGANDVHVADPAPAEQEADEEETARSDSIPSSSQQGVVIKCPICFDYYSEIVQNGRQLVATLCGHVFCSRCLPLALEISSFCPICRVELDPELYIPIYL